MHDSSNDSPATQHERHNQTTIQSVVAATPVDLGAAWLHKGDDPLHPMTVLCKQLDIELVCTDWTKAVYYDGAGLLAEEIATQAAKEDDTLDLIRQAAERRRNVLHDAATRMQHLQQPQDDSAECLDCSLADAVAVELEMHAGVGFAPGTRAQRMFDFHVQSAICDDYAATLSELSCLHWDADNECDGEQDLLPVGGYQQIIHHLAKETAGLTICTRAAVSKVDFSGDTSGRGNGADNCVAALVELQSGRQLRVAEGGAVVVAVPLGVLKQHPWLQPHTLVRRRSSPHAYRWSRPAARPPLAPAGWRCRGQTWRSSLLRNYLSQHKHNLEI